VRVASVVRECQASVSVNERDEEVEHVTDVRIVVRRAITRAAAFHSPGVFSSPEGLEIS